MAAGWVVVWDVGGDHGDVVSAREAVITSVLQSRKTFVGILGGLLQRISARRETTLAMQGDFDLEGCNGIAVTDLIGLGRLALIQQKEGDGELISWISELGWCWTSNPPEA